MRIVILRPEPGASETMAKAVERGFDTVVAPLFEVAPLAWTPPDPAEFDAVMLTSANAPRHAGPDIQPLLALPCYAVGERTAEAARAAGFQAVHAGPSDGDALARLMVADGVRRAVHLCGREHLAVGAPGFATTRLAVYSAEAAGPLPPAAVEALREGAVALLHSWRAAGRFALLVDQAGLDRSGVKAAAISGAAAAAAGGGWGVLRSASAPRDQALLELAAKLCKGAAVGETGSSR